MNRPNILFIMSDDHAAHAISAYGSRINHTPNIDRLAAEGMRLDNCHCTNSICTPSRATILTGQYGHRNGVYTLADKLDGEMEPQLQKVLRNADYETAMIGKWHLGHGGNHDPAGFDYWNVLPGQGLYYDPEMIELGSKKICSGYVTDIITEQSIKWLKQRDQNKPFMLMCHHKAPHRPWEPSKQYANLFEDMKIPEPETLYDDYSNRSSAAAAAAMRVNRDLTPTDLKQDPPEECNGDALTAWMYQRYIKDYLRCVQSVDDSVGSLLDFLESESLLDETIIIYTSDQGFFLGDHGWYDKRFMYEESIRMPFLIRYPDEIPPGATSDRIVINNDFAPTLLDYAGLGVPDAMQGVSARAVMRGEVPSNWRESFYYRYWMHTTHHNVYAHYGIRTHKHKLIYFYSDGLGLDSTGDEAKVPEWELFDLELDPFELQNVYSRPEYQATVRDLTTQLEELQLSYGDEAQH